MKIPDYVNRSIEAENRNRDDRFLETVSKAGWQVLKRGDSLNLLRSPEIIVIGVAVWSHPDMTALAALSSRKESLTVKVFQLEEAPTFDEITRFMPGMHPFIQTPVIAKYFEGKLVQTLEGQAARDWMEGKAK
jgi:hypothetical protein